MIRGNMACPESEIWRAFYSRYPEEPLGGDEVLLEPVARAALERARQFGFIRGLFGPRLSRFELSYQDDDQGRRVGCEYKAKSVSERNGVRTELGVGSWKSLVGGDRAPHGSIDASVELPFDDGVHLDLSFELGVCGEVTGVWVFARQGSIIVPYRSVVSNWKPGMDGDPIPGLVELGKDLLGGKLIKEIQKGGAEVIFLRLSRLGFDEVKT